MISHVSTAVPVMGETMGRTLRDLHGPWLDMLLLGGASVIAYVLIVLLDPTTTQTVVLGGVMMVLANFVNHPHFAHSYQIFYPSWLALCKARVWHGHDGCGAQEEILDARREAGLAMECLCLLAFGMGVDQFKQGWPSLLGNLWHRIDRAAGCCNCRLRCGRADHAVGRAGCIAEPWPVATTPASLARVAD